ncbi:hypothetical protein PFISCL1PPCAC_26233, partial [Pristionchus fissidentatus]
CCGWSGPSSRPSSGCGCGCRRCRCLYRPSRLALFEWSFSRSSRRNATIRPANLLSSSSWLPWWMNLGRRC